jgi:hypothetical protein
VVRALKVVKASSKKNSRLFIGITPAARACKIKGNPMKKVLTDQSLLFIV